MSNRLDQITTRTGDDGHSSLADGTRLPKSALRFDAMGDVDELNAHIGVLIAHLRDCGRTDCVDVLLRVQHHLFEIGSELAVPGMVFLRVRAVAELEHWGELTNAQLPSLKEFILPNGTLAATHAQVCRTVARRAERALVRLNQVEAMPDESLKYLNRCSDVLFIMARYVNQMAQVDEVYWRGNDA